MTSKSTLTRRDPSDAGTPLFFADDSVAAASQHRRIARAALLPTLIGMALITAALAAIWWPLTPEQQPDYYRALIYHGAAGVVAALFLYALRRAKAPGRAWPRWSVALCVLAWLGSIDRIVALAIPPPREYTSIFETHPRRGWQHRPNSEATWGGVRVSINSQGARGPEVAAQRAPNEFRILFAGDSTMFGWGVAENDTLPAQTQRELTQRFPQRRIVAINAGVSGYSTWQTLDLLNHEGRGFQPDLIVMGFCFNDVTDLIGLEPGELTSAEEVLSVTNARVSWSGLVRALSGVNDWRRWGRDSAIRIRERPHHDATELFAEPPPPEQRAAWTQALHALDGLPQCLAETKIPGLLFCFPLACQCRPGGKPDSIQQPIRAWAAQHGVTRVDPLPRLAAAGARRKPNDTPLFIDETHATRDGYRLMAEELAETIAAAHLIH